MRGGQVVVGSDVTATNDPVVHEHELMTRSLRSRIVLALQGPRMELFQSAACSEAETTYLGASFMNGAPGSSSAVPADQDGANS